MPNPQEKSRREKVDLKFFFFFFIDLPSFPEGVQTDFIKLFVIY